MTKIVDVLAQKNQGVGAYVVSIGLVLDSGQIGWGDCVDLVTEDDLLLAAVQRYVVPLLKGRELGSFRALSAEIEALTETITLVETIHHPPPPKKSGVSRRKIFTLQWEPEQPPAPPPTVRESYEYRPIFPSVRHGASQAVLSALALAQQLPIAEIIRREYNLPVPTQTTPTLPFLKMRQLNAAKRLMAYRPSSIGFEIEGTDFDAQLGTNGTVLKNALTRLCHESSGAVPPFKFGSTFYFRVNGGIGVQQGQSNGKVLGQLFVLHKQTKPYRLLIEDPIVHGDFDEHLKQNGRFKKLVKMRKIDRILVARQYADSLEQIKAMIDAEMTHLIYLDPQKLGSVGIMITALQHCREAEIGVIWGGSSAETTLSAQISAQIVMAVQPDFVVTKPATQVGLTSMQNDMARILQWMEHNQINKVVV